MESKPLELGLLRSFSPLDGLKSENLHALARKTVLHSLAQGRPLFKEGDTDKRTYYVVSGVLELLHEGRSVLVIRGGTPEARNPVAPGNPRRYTARVVSERMEYVAIDSDTWGDLFAELADMVVAHANEEETQIFPAAQDALGEDVAKTLEAPVLRTNQQVAEAV